MLRNSLNPGQRSSIIDPLRAYIAAENGNKWGEWKYDIV
ncbi:hypothetical protein CLOBOL_01936 [Enterocloster bolteae ATCC BAA-613]|uniref:Uncharacterized protein n=1 Tax=Enterocloster bolteae (strain ATCC BAA-613 / DSM 15670 / CCUG 46953 / JCM 12243 / WAL 16351) TaxID=411902 RepID=A8RMK1_ENTBW|nr:hypothetical protein CLOBOL_01936 [Enterocloster bolteae ATCC BAA-613]